jgi:EAL domain-containing protein
MASRRRGAHTPLRTSKQDIAAARRAPQTPQTASAAYRLAYVDDEFITSDETRGVRFQLEYLKPELRLKERGINSTVVLFGGARIPEPGKAAWAARNDTQKRNLEIASKYYEEARRFAQYASLTSEALGVSPVAEGVEGKADCETLTELGFESAQGFYFARPLPFAQFKELLRRRRPKRTPAQYLAA